MDLADKVRFKLRLEGAKAVTACLQKGSSRWMLQPEQRLHVILCCGWKKTQEAAWLYQPSPFLRLCSESNWERP